MVTFLIRYPYVSNARKHATQDEKQPKAGIHQTYNCNLETFLKHDLKP